MKSLLLRRGLVVALVGVVGLIVIAAFHKPDDSSDISSDVSSEFFRRLPKSQIPEQPGDLEESTNVMIHQPANLNFDHLSILESRITALQEKMDKVISLNFDDNQGSRCFLRKKGFQEF